MEDLPRACTMLDVYKVFARDRTEDINKDFSEGGRLFTIILHSLTR